MKYRTMKYFLLILISLSFVCILSAEIRYDKKENAVIVAGYPEEAPATLQDILNADQKNGWGKIRFEQKTQTYFLNCNLWIGAPKYANSYFQIGTERNLHETLVIKGSIWVIAPKESPERSDGRFSFMNSLTLGSAENHNIKGTIKFDCSYNGEHALCIGTRLLKARSKPEIRGRLCVYNSKITALTQDMKHRWSGRYKKHSYGCYASELHIENSEISYFTDKIFYGIYTGNWPVTMPARTRNLFNMQPRKLFTMKNSVFANGGRVIEKTAQYIENCTFRNINIPVTGNNLALKAINCSFEGNNRNWSFGGYNSLGALFIDCNIKNSAKPDIIKNNKFHSPVCRIMKTLVLKVEDHGGNPVKNAIVTVSCPKYPDAVHRGAMTTNEQGLTGEDRVSNSILITTELYKISKTNNKVQKFNDFEYHINVVFQDKTQKSVLKTLPPFKNPVIIKLK